ncbi:hypothetical protein NC652_032147 [Populus alba x Populus x berolinensis]|nr:hypothetical protein NC652_032147 [Populus alba x Populus x berolinensis]
MAIHEVELLSLTWRPFQPRLVTEYACCKIMLHSGKYESVHEYLQESEQERGISISPYRRSSCENILGGR